MKGIILAGGRGKRLYPLTKVVNKHLLHVHGKPMIHWALVKMKEARVTEAAIVINRGERAMFAEALQPFEHLYPAYQFIEQPSPNGIAAALALAENFTNGEKFVMLLGDNLFEDDLTDYLAAYLQSERPAQILLSPTVNPKQFAIATLSAKNELVSLREKPDIKGKQWAVTGIYCFDATVFDHIAAITPSARNELEITDVLIRYLKRGELEWRRLKGWWIDAGTHQTYQLANEWLGGY